MSIVLAACWRVLKNHCFAGWHLTWLTDQQRTTHKTSPPTVHNEASTFIYKIILARKHMASYKPAHSDDEVRVCIKGRAILYVKVQ